MSEAILVIGAGPAGLAAATRLARGGRRVLLADRGPVGGVCLNGGCIPMRRMISDASCTPRSAAAAVAPLRTALRDRIVSEGVDVVEAAASFLSPGSVVLTAADGTRRTLAPEAVIVATGSADFRPKVFPDSPRFSGAAGFFALDHFPESVIVVGGGVFGCEVAESLARSGTFVTLVERESRLLPSFDDDLAAAVLARFETNENIRVLVSAEIEAAGETEAGVELKLAGETLRAERAILACGRVPNTAGLALYAAGVGFDAAGFVVADAFGRTAAEGVFAVGDVVAGSALTAHAATEQGRAVADLLLGREVRPRAFVLPKTVDAGPGLAMVGLSERAAARKGVAVCVAKVPFRGNGRAFAEAETAGFAKWIFSEEGVALGAAVAGAGAVELISFAAIAVEKKMTAAEIADLPFAHPSRSEIWAAAASRRRE